MNGDEEVFRPRWFWFVEWTSDSEAVFRAAKKLVAYEKTPFQEVAVIDSFVLNKTLVIDGKVQSSLFDEYIYHESLVHPAMISHGNPKRVLVLGGGEGATLREVLKYKTVREAVMVDIDEKVVSFAKKHLGEWHRGAFDDERARLVIMDGRKFVENSLERGEKYDVIILDLVDPLEGGPALKLYTKEFYEKIKGLLGEGGVMVTQATSHSFYPRVFATIYHTIRHVFGHARTYSTCIRSFNGDWDFVIGYLGEDPAKLGSEDVDERLLNLIGNTNSLRFYDGITHARLMRPPKNVRDLLKRYTSIATDDNPQYINF